MWTDLRDEIPRLNCNRGLVPPINIPGCNIRPYKVDPVSRYTIYIYIYIYIYMVLYIVSFRLVSLRIILASTPCAFVTKLPSFIDVTQQIGFHSVQRPLHCELFDADPWTNSR